MFCHMKEVYFTAWPFSKLQVLHWPVARAGEYRQISELYDLESDPGETNNLYDSEPEVVAELSALLDDCRRDMGDEATGIQGKNVRPIGRVANSLKLTTPYDPKHPSLVMLTRYDPRHPYVVEEYDLDDEIR